MSNYPVVIRRLEGEEGSGVRAEVPDLPGCVATGDTESEALYNVGRAIAEWIGEAQRRGRRVPEPRGGLRFSGKWVQRVPKSLHRELAQEAKREGVSLNQLVTALLAEGLGRRRRTG